MARAETARVKELESILEQRSSDLSDANERYASFTLQTPVMVSWANNVSAFFVYQGLVGVAPQTAVHLLVLAVYCT